MAIQNRSGENVSPKQLAVELFVELVNNFDLSSEYNNYLTEKQLAQVENQVSKYKTRLLKVLGVKAAGASEETSEED